MSEMAMFRQLPHGEAEFGRVEHQNGFLRVSLQVIGDATLIASKRMKMHRPVLTILADDDRSERLGATRSASTLTRLQNAQTCLSIAAESSCSFK